MNPVKHQANNVTLAAGRRLIGRTHPATMAATAGARYIAKNLVDLLGRIQANDGTWLATDLGHPNHVDNTVELPPSIAHEVGEPRVAMDAVVTARSRDARNTACKRYISELFALADHCDRLEPPDISSVVTQRAGSYSLHMVAFGVQRAFLGGGGIVEIKTTAPGGDWCSMVIPKAGDDRAAYRHVMADKRFWIIRHLFPLSGFEIHE